MNRSLNGTQDATLSDAEAEIRDLALVRAVPPDQRPARVYLTRLGEGSRRTMQTALDTMAALLTGQRCDADTLDWSRLRYQHTAAVRAVLLERYQPATTNKHLAALRGVLREAWQLGREYRRHAHRWRPSLILPRIWRRSSASSGWTPPPR